MLVYLLKIGSDWVFTQSFVIGKQKSSDFGKMIVRLATMVQCFRQQLYNIIGNNAAVRAKVAFFESRGNHRRSKVSCEVVEVSCQSTWNIQTGNGSVWAGLSTRPVNKSARGSSNYPMAITVQIWMAVDKGAQPRLIIGADSYVSSLNYSYSV